jgi:hypothetical protein
MRAAQPPQANSIIAEDRRSLQLDFDAIGLGLKCVKREIKKPPDLAS